MRKRILAIVTILCALPVIASAWQLNTWVKSPGGTLTVTKNAVGGVQPPAPIAYTSVNGSVFKTYTDVNRPTVAIAALPGYMISYYIVDGVTTTPAAGTTNAAPAIANGSLEKVYVAFIKQTATLTISSQAGGFAAPTGTLRNATPGAVIDFYPTNGKAFDGYSSSNVTFVPALSNQGAGAAVGKYSLPMGLKQTISVATITGNATLVAKYRTVAAVVDPSQTDAAKAKSCDSCHIAQGIDSGAIYVPWSSGGHKAKARNASLTNQCNICHTANSTHPGVLVDCASCHSGVATAGFVNFSSRTVINLPATGTFLNDSDGFSACDQCHTGGALNIGATTNDAAIHGGKQNLSDDCLACHAIAIKHAGTVVSDNSGVRAIAGEFAKNSHHVTGKVLTNADCAVCHAEGMKNGAAVVVDTKIHMKDGKIYLRNGNAGLAQGKATTVTSKNGTAVSVYAWDPANPDHALMDQYCMSCHNNAGAPTTFAALGTAIAGLGTSSALNPFGDTLSNGYDQIARPQVVGVYEQFDTANTSHHAVRGKKYNVRTSPVAGRSALWAKYSSATNTGARQTLYEAGAFVATYTPLGAAASVGDDSTLHCGDCHTVGQFKAGSTTNALGTPTTAVIGAHGSANEYMLRNAYGSDALHHQGGYNGSTIGVVSAAGGNYVCFLCHNIANYNGTDGTHNGIDESTRCNGQETVGLKGVQAAAGTATGTGLNQTQNTFRISGVSTGSGQGNLFGYSCAYCHNAGDKGFGGIHGTNATFKAYSGSTSSTLVTRKPYRFMGGLSLRYNGGNNPDNASAATGGSWERKAVSSGNHDGCYNLTTTADNTSAGQNMLRIWGTDATSNGTGATSTDQNKGVNYNASAANPPVVTNMGTWGACGHHTGSTTSGAATGPTRKIQRPLSY
jgi:hypothetical protein